MTTRWITVEKAAEHTGLGIAFFHEHTGISGDWPEGQVWKWFGGRKLIDLDAFYRFVDKAPSVPTIRRRKVSEPTNHAAHVT